VKEVVTEVFGLSDWLSDFAVLGAALIRITAANVRTIYLSFIFSIPNALFLKIVLTMLKMRQMPINIQTKFRNYIQSHIL